MTRKSAFFFFFSLLFFSPSISQSVDSLLTKHHDSVATLITRDWVLSSVVNRETNLKEPNFGAGRLTFKGDRFTLHVKHDNIQGGGNWEFRNNKLRLFFDLHPISTEIDSCTFKVLGGHPAIVYFKSGREIATIQNGKLHTPDSLIEYRITSLTRTQFEIKEKKYWYFFTAKETEDTVALPITNTGLIRSTGVTLESIGRGIIGLISLVLVAFMFSSNRKAISWPLVIKGLLFQLVFAILVLKVPFVTGIFEVVSGFFVKIISFTQAGTDFLFGSFVTSKIEIALINFVVQVLPTIIFFAALTSLLYYYGVLQKIVYVFAWIMKKVMRLSGAESLAAAGNIFLGQTESPLLIKPYLNSMTRSELMCLMSGGMATIAGGVMAAYIGFLGGGDPEQQLFYAKHLLAASVMSAPAAIVAAKILVPETEPYQEKLIISKEKLGTNALEAIANGTTEGIKLSVNVAGMLLVFIAFIAMANFFLEDIFGYYLGINDKIASLKIGDYKTFSLEFILGLLFAPLAWLMGVTSEDVLLVGQLLGEKTILNEFVAYVSLGEMKDGLKFTEEKSIIMATYILCGFANFASIGIQIGGIGSLVPNRKGVLAELGIRALIGGTLASLFTAVIVGVIL